MTRESLPKILTLETIARKLFGAGDLKAISYMNEDVTDYISFRRQERGLHTPGGGLEINSSYQNFLKWLQKDLLDRVMLRSSRLITRDDFLTFLECLKQEIAEHGKRPADEPWDVTLHRINPEIYTEEKIGLMKKASGKEDVAGREKMKGVASAYRKQENEWAATAKQVVDKYKENPFWDQPVRKKTKNEKTCLKILKAYPTLKNDDLITKAKNGCVVHGESLTPVKIGADRLRRIFQKLRKENNLPAKPGRPKISRGPKNLGRIP